MEGIHYPQVETMANWLFEHMGAGVNIANVMPEHIINIQALRCGGIGLTDFTIERSKVIEI